MSRREEVDFNADHPIHDAVFGSRAVFGSDPDGLYNDTPRGAIGENVNITSVPAQSERDQPLRHMGETNHRDRQPDGEFRK